MKDLKEESNEEYLDTDEVKIKDEKQKITRGEITKMYALLFLHTLIITIILFILNKEKREFMMKNFFIFCGYFFGSIVFSFLVLYCNFFYKILSIITEIFFKKYISTITNFLIYIILLGLNIFAFIYGSKLNEEIFQLIKFMFIIFDLGSIIIILLSFCIKNNSRSISWLVWISAITNILIIILLEIKYKDTKYLSYGILFVFIYIIMNYKFIESIESNEKKMIISIFSLPCFLNIYFILFFSVVILFIWWVIKFLLKILKKK